MADNPFLKYTQATPGAVITDDNPFSKYAHGQKGQSASEEIGNRFTTYDARTDPATGRSVAYPSSQAKAFDIDFSAPHPVVRASIAALPEEDRPAATKQWAAAVVSKEAQDSPITTTISDKLRQVARGTPVGSWLDEANASTMGGLHKATGGKVGAPYDETLAYNRARDEHADESSTKLGALPLIGDVTTGGLAKVAGGLMSAPVAPIWMGKAASMAGQMGRSAVSAGGYGALYGAGEGDSLGERTQNAVTGGLVGAGIGAAAPPIARGISNAYEAATNGVRPRPPELRGYSRQATDKVSTAAADDNIIPSFPPRLIPKPRGLGDEGMLADMGPNLRETTGALAALPGKGRASIEHALSNRREGAKFRIDADVTDALGPAQNLVQAGEQVAKVQGAKAAPLYTQFYATPLKVTSELASALDRAHAAGAWQKAQTMMRIDGFDPSKAQLNGMFVDYIKRAVDDMSSAAVRSGEKEASRRFTQLAKAIREETDKILSPHNPKESIWAKARHTAGEGLQFADGLDQGRTAFRTSVHPNQMAADVSGMSAPERMGYVSGARGAVRDAAGNAATSIRANSETAMLRQLGSDYSRQKLAHIAKSPESAQRLANRLDAEATFLDTHNQVLANSKTATRQAAQKSIPNAAVDGGLPDLKGVTAAGLVAQGTMKVIDSLRRGAITAQQTRVATDMARMLVAQGADRELIIKGLRDYVRSRNATAGQRTAIDKVIRDLMSGSRQKLIEAKTSDAGSDRAF